MRAGAGHHYHGCDIRKVIMCSQSVLVVQGVLQQQRKA